ncbi:MAG: hypothetical protein JRF06_06940 [Deltaproteobacteria bacterium]|nr:hypothetical protein [Deltaproteobacteria bacterium]
MGSIETTKDISSELTINIAKGKIMAEDLLNWVSDYYSGTVTKLILWNCIEADLSNITSEEFEKIARLVKKRSDIRKSGKTAFVFNRDVEFGLGRMYEALSKIEDIQSENKTFRDMTEAKKWLGV